MRDTTDSHQVPGDVVGESRPQDAGKRGGFPAFLRLQGSIWIVVILLALLFVAAIIGAAIWQ